MPLLSPLFLFPPLPFFLTSPLPFSFSIAPPVLFPSPPLSLARCHGERCKLPHAEGSGADPDCQRNFDSENMSGDNIFSNPACRLACTINCPMCISPRKILYRLESHVPLKDWMGPGGHGRIRPIGCSRLKFQRLY